MDSRTSDAEINLGEAKVNLAFGMFSMMYGVSVEADPQYVTLHAAISKYQTGYEMVADSELEVESLSEERHLEFFEPGSTAA